MDKYVRSFNHIIGSGYDINRANNILRCHQENRMEYYPDDYNKYDWLFNIIAKTIISNFAFPDISVPNIIFSPSFYGFLILDLYAAKNHDDLFQVIKNRLNLNSLQIKYLSRCSSLRPLIADLLNYRDRYLPENDYIFNNLRTNYQLRRKRDDLDVIEEDLKIMKLDD